MERMARDVFVFCLKSWTKPVSRTGPAQGLVVVDRWQDARSIAGPTVSGLAYKIYPGHVD